MTLTGAQLDAIIIGTGTINLGTGTGDTINLTSTSADLNTLGATDASIQGVEAISAAGAAAGVTITLTGQTEAFTITGSAQADTITGGTAADTIVAGAGDDTIDGGAGNDTIDGGPEQATRWSSAARAADYTISLRRIDLHGRRQPRRFSGWHGYGDQCRELPVLRRDACRGSARPDGSDHLLRCLSALMMERSRPASRSTSSLRSAKP